jgi:predicted transcriptional regulator
MASDINIVELATELTVAWLGNHSTRTNADDVPAFLRSMHDALEKLAAPISAEQASEPPREYTPATTVRKSLASREHIVSMIDGKQYRSLRRHLSANGLTPDEYRQRYRLKPDYPMTAPAYSEARSAMAKTIGLGRKPGQKVKQVAEQMAAPIEAAGKRVRKSAAEAKVGARAHLGGE